MAAESSVENLRDEATCSVCLDFFRDPVMIMGCGHNFCRACITQYWEGAETDVTCPQCRQTFPQRTLGPNRQVGNLVELVKGLSVRLAEGAGGQRVCGEHGETLKLFCQDDEAPICVVCDRSWVHRAHSVVPLEEAAEEYKEKLQAHLKTLRERRENLLGLKWTGEGKTQEYLKQAGAERQKIVSEFQQLHRILLEQEQLLLAQLGELEKEAEKIQKEKVIKLSEEISHLSELISKMESKFEQPASEFLQDIRKTLSRCEEGEIPQPVLISPELERRLQDFCQTICALTETGRKFKETLPSALEKRSGDVPQPYTKDPIDLTPSFMKRAAAERQKIVSEFQQSYQFLQEQEQLLLAQLGELEKKVENMQKEKVIKLSEEISHLNELISEMEAKCQQPASEFLQDIRKTLSRCDKGEIPRPVPISPDLERRFHDFSKKTCALRKTMRTFKDTLPSGLEKISRDVPQPYAKGYQKVLEQEKHQAHLKTLRERREDLLELKQSGERKTQEYLDIRKTLSRCDKGEIPQPVPISSELERRLQDFCQTTCALTETGRKFKDTLPSVLEKRSGDVPQPYTKVMVTLDPDTAHPKLILSADKRSVTLGGRRQDLPDNPERFDFESFVLGHEELTWGRHYWEVEVDMEESDGWALGIARETLIEEQEQLLLAQLGELEGFVNMQKEKGTKLSEEISNLNELIGEMEAKCQQPASEFLQDIRTTLSRYRTLA
ncbi:zinc finger protein RFP-like [Alligator mississippiensis]|uniref:Zinc finger protein RFP-like n=1 Tax=Alligator mississippiensis TaxID=8496 RepID=A0A151MLI7_ALLMI|nr:zinc finger protein RFP-like [Alligator mississippiensis]